MAISKHHAVGARASDAALHRDTAAWLEIPRCRIPEAVSHKPAIDLNQTSDSLILAGVDSFNQDQGPTGQPIAAASEHSRCSDDAEPVVQGYPQGRARSELETRSLTRTATFFPHRDPTQTPKASESWPKTRRQHCGSRVPISAGLAMPLIHALHLQSTACRDQELSGRYHRVCCVG